MNRNRSVGDRIRSGSKQAKATNPIVMSAHSVGAHSRLLALGPSHETHVSANHRTTARDRELAVRHHTERHVLGDAAGLEERDRGDVRRDQGTRERAEVARGRARARLHAPTSLREHAAATRTRARGTRKGPGRARAQCRSSAAVGHRPTCTSSATTRAEETTKSRRKVTDTKDIYRNRIY